MSIFDQYRDAQGYYAQQEQLRFYYQQFNQHSNEQRNHTQQSTPQSKSKFNELREKAIDVEYVVTEIDGKKLIEERK